jgi:hypothetical protein
MVKGETMFHELSEKNRADLIKQVERWKKQLFLGAEVKNSQDFPAGISHVFHDLDMILSLLYAPEVTEQDNIGPEYAPTKQFHHPTGHYTARPMTRDRWTLSRYGFVVTSWTVDHSHNMYFVRRAGTKDVPYITEGNWLAVIELIHRFNI